jgi:hypothetical protein
LVFETTMSQISTFHEPDIHFWTCPEFPGYKSTKVPKPFQKPHHSIT